LSRRLFDTNFWGIVHGSMAAARHFKERGQNSQYAGVLINLGSVVSDRVFPLQGMYATTKHAIKGFTDVLRMELAHEKVPVAVVLIKPSAIATPFAQHARNYMEKEPTLPPPLYAPEAVAEAIVKCMTAPQRDVLIGGAGKMMSALGQYFPGLGDKVMGSKQSFESNKREGLSPKRTDSLYEPGYGMNERGDFPGQHISEESPYTRAVQSPLARLALAVGAGLGVLAWAARTSRR